jgi:hypothetical protein
VGDIKQFPQKPKDSRAVKTFFNKSTNDMTLGDALIMQAASATVSTVVELALQGWILGMRTLLGKRA